MHDDHHHGGHSRDHDHGSHSHSHDHRHPHPPGHNGPAGKALQWQTPHLPDDRAREQPADVKTADIDLVETAFLEGFARAPDPSSFLRLAGIPFVGETADGRRLHLLRVETEDLVDVGAVMPLVGGAGVAYHPLPARLTSHRRRAGFRLSRRRGAEASRLRGGPRARRPLRRLAIRHSRARARPIVIALNSTGSIMKMRSIIRPIFLTSLAVLTPSLALAHGGGDHVHGFVTGLEHPLLGVDHLLAMVAVGAIGSRVGRGVLLVPLAFVAAMLAAALLGMAGFALPSLEAGIAVSLVVLGAVLSLIRPLPLAAAASIAALFGLFHGNAHGLEIPEGAGGLAYAAGFVLATSALHAAGTLSAVKLRRWPGMVRTAGFATSLVGMLLAVQAV